MKQLQKKENRAWVLFPPTIIITAIGLLAIANMFFDILNPIATSWLINIYIFFVGYLLIGLTLIFRSDYKAMKK